jgi:hypothetical protein
VGKLVHADGTTYEGEWSEDKKHGHGEEVLASGITYEGEFSEGKKHGRGKVVLADGRTYEGNFVNSMPHGVGKEALADGTTYEGEWIEGKKHGKGKLVEDDGTTYEGEFVNDLPQGVGKLVYADGSIFEGEILMYMPHGYGVYTQGVDGKSLGSHHAGSAGDVCDGNWSRGQRHGECKYTFCNGMTLDCHWLYGFCAEFTMCRATILAATGNAAPRDFLLLEVEQWPLDSDSRPLPVLAAHRQAAAVCDFIARWDNAALLRLRRSLLQRQLEPISVPRMLHQAFSSGSTSCVQLSQMLLSRICSNFPALIAMRLVTSRCWRVGAHARCRLAEDIVNRVVRCGYRRTARVWLVKQLFCFSQCKKYCVFLCVL